MKVPTIADRVTEPTESVRLRLITTDDNFQEVQGPEVTGTVRDPR
ncbi:hypothetical protein [Streptomyces caeruleatus]|nr:hypothetical protein [Streptomyces caeruleatus]